MARKKILVSESVKGELLDQYSGVDNISLGDFSAQVIGNGLDDLKNSEPPGASPRVVPRANGNKYVEFSLDDHKQLDREVQKFKKDKKYTKDTTAYRACLCHGLGIDPANW